MVQAQTKNGLQCRTSCNKYPINIGVYKLKYSIGRTYNTAFGVDDHLTCHLYWACGMQVYYVGESQRTTARGGGDTGQKASEQSCYCTETSGQQIVSAGRRFVRSVAYNPVCIYHAAGSQSLVIKLSGADRPALCLLLPSPAVHPTKLYQVANHDRFNYCFL